MSLIPKLEIESVNNSATEIFIKDITGNYSTSNIGGYGGPNIQRSAVDSIIFTISHYDQHKYDKVRYVRVPVPSRPEYLTVPSIDQITSGTIIGLNSLTLGRSSVGKSLIPFKDGIYDINMHVITKSAPSSYKGYKGGYFIESNSAVMMDIFNKYDSIIINNNIYNIDKTTISNNNILYIEQPLKEDFELGILEVAYRGNVKAYSDVLSDKCIITSIGVLSVDKCSRCDSKKKEEDLFKYIMYKIAAELEFECGNYSKANDLLVGAYQGCSCNKCNC